MSLMELLVPTNGHSALPFSFSKSIHFNNLAIWQEIIGQIINYEIRNGQVILHLGTCQGNISLACTGNSIEAKIIHEFLKGNYQNRLIGLFKTDLGDRPITVRWIK